jgi:hypothetical protein
MLRREVIGGIYFKRKILVGLNRASLPLRSLCKVRGFRIRKLLLIVGKITLSNFSRRHLFRALFTKRAQIKEKERLSKVKLLLSRHIHHQASKNNKTNKKTKKTLR